MTNLIPPDLDDLLCLSTRLRIVIAARDKIPLSDIRKIADDVRGTCRHQSLRLEQANYITIHR